MKVTPYSELRWNFAATLNSVVNNHNPVLITCGRSKPAVVLMSLEEYASWDETNYLLNTPRNAERLRQSIAELEAAESKGRIDQHHLPPQHPRQNPPRIPTRRA